MKRVDITHMISPQSAGCSPLWIANRKKWVSNAKVFKLFGLSKQSFGKLNKTHIFH
jgi:hypothetical protein